LYEELFISERSQSTEVAKITTTVEQWLPADKLEEKLNQLSEYSTAQDSESIKSVLMELAFLEDVSSPKSKVEQESRPVVEPLISTV